MKKGKMLCVLVAVAFLAGCKTKEVQVLRCPVVPVAQTETITKADLMDKIKGGWAGQVIGCAYGGPTEFCYRGVMIPDERELEYPAGHLKFFYDKNPTLFDDIYMDLTFVEVLREKGLKATPEDFGVAFANRDYGLWHANQAARYNVLHGVMPPESGHWLNNPHADCIDYQIESDFAGLMSPGMPNVASELSDRVGHVMNYGDGWYGGVFTGAMYTEAFFETNVLKVVETALKTIPPESDFYKRISQVIAWYKEDPSDWKRCWTLYNENYSEDVGCPELILAPGNIDATMNSAYVVMGLLYGNKDFKATMEIATRCGQDSDCNPSTAAGILATITGYSNIPEFWMPNVKEVEDIDFIYTKLSLNTTYQAVYDLAIQNVLANGGATNATEVTIVREEPKAVRFEKSFPNMRPVELAKDLEFLGTPECKQNTFTFTGKGFAIHGYLSCPDTQYESQLEVSVDGKPVKTFLNSSDYRRKIDTLCWKYDLPYAPHTVTLKLLNPKEGANLKASRVFYYEPKE
ncbi:ADP-ribosylglycohydrolase family protein [bacterium]|nr:ADP-ribosylglycohydrolase family protein [bacterium]